MGPSDYNARWYQASVGAFISPDTIISDREDPQSFNRYSYVGNNPVGYTDPSGHCRVVLAAARHRCGTLSFVYSCIVDVMDALEGYEEGERRPAALYAHASGVTDSLVSIAQDIDRLNQGVHTVFSNAPLMDRIGPSIRVGSTAVLTAATLVGGVQVAQAKLGARGGLSARQLNLLMDDYPTLRPGPYASESIPARGSGRNWLTSELEGVNLLGNTYGCHACGARTPGTRSGNWIPDHQPSSRLNLDNLPQRLYPHCSTCNALQGGHVSALLRKLSLLR